METTGGSFRIEPRTILADDTYGAAPVAITAHRGDTHLDVMNVQVARFDNGRLAEFWETTTDQQASEEFWK